MLFQFHSIEKREVPIGTEVAHINGKHFETKKKSDVKAAKPLCGLKTGKYLNAIGKVR